MSNVIVNPYCEIGRNILNGQGEVRIRLYDWLDSYSGSINAEHTTEFAEFGRAEDECLARFDEHCRNCDQCRTTMSRFEKKRPRSLMSGGAIF
jgi:hypothetical protein